MPHRAVRNVVVTGGSRGFGGALVRRLASSGARVVYTYRHSPPDDVTGPSRSLGILCDVADRTDVEWLFLQARDFFDGGPIDAVVNNAAESGSYAAFVSRVGGDAAESVLRTNVLGVMHCSHAALETFRDQQLSKEPANRRMGHLFNVSGAGSDGRATPNFAAYGASKAAVAQFTRSLRAEVGRDAGVHVLSPGLMRTPLLLDGLPDGPLRGALTALAEDPDAVAAWASSKILATVDAGKARTFHRYVNVPGALTRVCKSVLRLP